MFYVTPLLEAVKAVDGEISQVGNLNAYSRLLCLSQYGQVAKIFTNLLMCVKHKRRKVQDKK